MEKILKSDDNAQDKVGDAVKAASLGLRESIKEAMKGRGVHVISGAVKSSFLSKHGTHGYLQVTIAFEGYGDEDPGTTIAEAAADLAHEYQFTPEELQQRSVKIFGEKIFTKEPQEKTGLDKFISLFKAQKEGKHEKN